MVERIDEVASDNDIIRGVLTGLLSDGAEARRSDAVAKVDVADKKKL